MYFAICKWDAASVCMLESTARFYGRKRALRRPGKKGPPWKGDATSTAVRSEEGGAGTSEGRRFPGLVRSASRLLLLALPACPRCSGLPLQDAGKTGSPHACPASPTRILARGGTQHVSLLHKNLGFSCPYFKFHDIVRVKRYTERIGERGAKMVPYSGRDVR